MERVLIIGASGGIGAALASAAEARGAEVVRLSRSGDGFDITDPASVSAHLGRLEGPFDALVVATGILAPPGGAPEKALAAVEAEAMAQVFATNAIGPALVLGQAKRLLPRERRAVVGVLSARVGSIGDNRLGGWHSYRASKAALNQIIRGAAIELARTHPQAVVAALHPGTVETPFTEGYPRDKLPPAEAARRLWAVLEGLPADESGGFFDHRGARVPW
ncbi:SDR family NAD(P)-dependent oxidoreductase [Pseudoroseicyclus tamaricis]|uniref:SDR family NAD(P)-dependent oxidoreductase n=1 Tax=Pseudoroseicyclus tamaricis TaxID=2705421 RepID=A0A6B2JUJ6_9RHOB|nr:SDR family NAD(P)-dependent oxidoreductase [Pseudoroseicyclus tamaricis]NDV02197.1 SDR family NAD(P)-dependent oxidoreductase [Pseudoroseicyclus tamaricis]